MKKIALFVFNGELMCFVHVLLNALDMHKNGYEGKIVIESSATKLIPELADKGNPLHILYEKTKDMGLIDGACKACSKKMGVMEAVRAEDIPLLDDMKGHPGIARYKNEGFEIITF